MAELAEATVSGDGFGRDRPQVLNHARVGDMLVDMLQQPLSGDERGAGRGGLAVTIEPRDNAERGYCELTVAGVDRVVIRDTGRHTLKVVERRIERTGVS